MGRMGIARPSGIGREFDRAAHEDGRIKGRVAVLKQYHPAIEIEEVEVPALEPGAILVKTTMAGVCGSDLHTWRGDQAARALPPSGSAFGHEGIGVVNGLRLGVSTDSAGESLREGDRIVHNAQVSWHRCPQCLGVRMHLTFCSSFLGTDGDPVRRRSTSCDHQL